MDTKISLLWRLIALTSQLITNNGFALALSLRAFVGALLDKNDWCQLAEAVENPCNWCNLFRKTLHKTVQLWKIHENSTFGTAGWYRRSSFGHACRRKEKDRTGMRIFAERYWCHDYTTLHWQHASCLRPLFRLDMELPKPTRVLCIASNYVSFLLAWLLYNEIYTNWQIKQNNGCLKCQDCTSQIWDTQNIWFRKTKACRNSCWANLIFIFLCCLHCRVAHFLRFGFLKVPRPFTHVCPHGLPGGLRVTTKNPQLLTVEPEFACFLSISCKDWDICNEANPS